MKKLFCQMLVVLMAWTPFQFAQAGMIGTDRIVAAAAQSERGTVVSFLARSDVASQLQSFGLDASTAKHRVAAMSDEEVHALAGRIDALPAGASDAGWLVVIILVAVIWWVMGHPGMR